MNNSNSGYSQLVDFQAADTTTTPTHPNVQHSPQDQLEFQNFVLSSAEQNLVSGNLGSGGRTPGLGAGQQQQQQPLIPQQQQQQQHGGYAAAPLQQSTASANTQQQKSYGFWTLEYYMQFFNVDTNDVAFRILATVQPHKSFFDVISTNPDAYGPFWIPTTLIFVIFACNNMAITLSNSFYGQKKAIDFNTLYIASATIYTYVSIIPAIVWGVTKYFRLSLPILDIVNVYGYGLSLWIPIALVCIVPSDMVRWAVVIFGLVWTGYFMISNIIPRILKPSDPNSTSTTLNKSASSVLTIFILGAHLVLAFMFKIYFFSFNTDIVGGGGKNSGDGSAATTTMSTSTTSTAAAALATP